MWNTHLVNPLQQQRKKPRSTGITMVMDKGLGLHAFRDLLDMSSMYIDFIKLGFGTVAITPSPILKQKLEIAKQYNIPIYPGGTFFEIAKAKNLLLSYFEELQQLGFSWIEISDGTITLTEQERGHSILEAKSWGFNVITEIGKKEKGKPVPLSNFISTYEHDRNLGSQYIIVEGRENGDNLSIFTPDEKLDMEFMNALSSSLDTDYLIWEAPKKWQQIELLKIIGSKVNFGNIPPQDIMAVECLRRGLRTDAFFFEGKND